MRKSSSENIIRLKLSNHWDSRLRISFASVDNEMFSESNSPNWEINVREFLNTIDYCVPNDTFG